MARERWSRAKEEAHKRTHGLVLVVTSALGAGLGTWGATIFTQHGPGAIITCVAVGTALGASVGHELPRWVEWFRDPRRQMELSISKLTDRLTEVESRPQTVTPPPEVKYTIPESVKRVVGGLQTGRLLLKRLPKESTWGVATPFPPELEREFNAWKVDVKRYLKPWPDYQKQFSGALVTDKSPFAFPDNTQEMRLRLDILTDIVQLLQASERIPEP